jgi:2,5-dihydroxypyridine 5,6-dioxygenase
MTDIFKMCNLKEGEKVLIFNDPIVSGASVRVPSDYGAAFREAAESLGGRVLGVDLPASGMVTGHGYENFGSELVDLMKNSDLIVNSDLYQTAHYAALHAGARSIMIMGPTSAQRRLIATEKMKGPTLKGAEYLIKGKKIRVTSAFGTDLVLDKTGRKANAEYGAADESGRWDNSQGGMVGCAPLEDSANGVVVVAPGDGLVPLGIYAQGPIKITFKDGKATKFDATDGTGKMFEGYLKKFGDERSLITSHIGWGVNAAADWVAGYTERSGQDWETKWGNTLFALGINTFDSPLRLCGLGGNNDAPSHFDIGMRNVSFYVDDELAVDGATEEIIPAAR